MRSWFNLLTFTDEEIKTQRGETFSKAWHWTKANGDADPLS